MTVIFSEQAHNVEYSTRHYNILFGARESKDLYFYKIHELKDLSAHPHSNKVNLSAGSVEMTVYFNPRISKHLKE